ncbi:MAG: hypothetical protein WAV38_08405 [Xanthobacteraceae bacterium]
MPDRVWSSAKSGSDKMVELLKAISAGREPPPTEEEWASLREFWRGKLGKRRRGHHKSMERYCQGVDARMLRHIMEFLKIDLQNDPAEREVKRTMRRDGGRYDLNQRVAQRMHARMMKWDRKKIPTVESLVNILSPETNGDLHPDAFAESVRWLVHEGEQIQAIGRSRAVNRTAESPLDIDLVFDTCLPITVDEVMNWETPSSAIEMVIEGAVLTSRVDMVKAWPSVWKNDMSAKRTVDEMKKEPVFGKIIADWRVITYQLTGPKMKSRIGYFNIPDPKAWLEQRLGVLKVYREGGPKSGEVQDDL